MAGIFEFELSNQLMLTSKSSEQPCKSLSKDKIASFFYFFSFTSLNLETIHLA